MELGNCENNPVLQVTMLGGFRLKYGQNDIETLNCRSKKVFMLLEYLISNRNKAITQEALTDAIWEEANSEVNDGVLKNLIYRARKLLIQLGASDEYILYTGGTYAWNNDFPCQVDIELMERYIGLAANSEMQDGQRIQYYFKAIELYRGEFLPRESSMRWVISKATYYSNLFVTCVNNVCALLAQRDNYKDIIAVCENALSIYAFEEDIHKMLIRAYCKIGYKSKAVAHYKAALELFYSELNVDITATFADVYKELTAEGGQVEFNTVIIKKNVADGNAQEGAFYCDKQSYKSIYHMLARSIRRTGSSVYMAVVTLSCRDGSVPKKTILDVNMPVIKEILVISLRSCDIVSPYSAAQFLLILQQTDIEGCEVVRKRVINRFNQKYARSNLMLDFRVNPMDPID